MMIRYDLKMLVICWMLLTTLCHKTELIPVITTVNTTFRRRRKMHRRALGLKIH